MKLWLCKIFVNYKGVSSRRHLFLWSPKSLPGNTLSKWKRNSSLLPQSMAVFQHVRPDFCSAKHELKPPGCNLDHLVGIFCLEQLLEAENKGAYDSKHRMSGGEEKNRACMEFQSLLQLRVTHQRMACALCLVQEREKGQVSLWEGQLQGPGRPGHGHGQRTLLLLVCLQEQKGPIVLVHSVLELWSFFL